MTIATLRDLLDLLPHDRFTGAPASARRAVRGFSTDTRSLTKGEVFIALLGETFNGHAFLDAAAERGASAAIVARSWFDTGSAPAGLPCIVVDDTLAAYGAIATAHRESFSYPVVAVAGSNGKTTTKELVADLLSAKYNVLRTEGNLNNLIGVPAMMLRMRPEHTAAVIEIGTNTPGEIAKLCAILRPTHGIITNIGREHLELLGSVEGVAREEGALFEYLAATGGTAFVNLDDPFIAPMGRRLPKRITYGMTKRAEIGGKRGRSNQFGAPELEITDRRKAEPKSLLLQLATPGDHTAGNALAAAAVALAFRISMRAIKRILEGFAPRIYKGGYARLAPMLAECGARLLNDTYNANPDSTLAALRTLRAIKPGRGGRRIAVLADMKELGASSREEHRKIGEELASIPAIDIALFHGDEMEHAHKALVKRAGKDRSRFFKEKESLADALVAMLAPEDVILIKGSRGMKMEDVVKRLVAERTFQFDTKDR
jgi:UDP-N-acetylmuramoyl-tripeptide--D-alanyl-D-alanine ligase